MICLLQCVQKNLKAQKQWTNTINSSDSTLIHVERQSHVLANALIEGKPFNTKDLNWNKGLLSTSTSAMLKDQLSPEPLR